MATSVGDLDRAIIAVWNGSFLNGTFRQYWRDPTSTQFPVLSDQEAPAAQPFPYCVFEKRAGNVQHRMTKAASSLGRMEIRIVPVVFNIHARSSVSYSAKALACLLADEVLKVFGGHPEVVPTVPTLDHGHCLISTYQSDNGIRTGEDEHQWVIEYNFTLDVPTAA